MVTDAVLVRGSDAPFGRFDGKSAIEMGVEAVREALADADVSWGEIDALFCGHMYARHGGRAPPVQPDGPPGSRSSTSDACSSGGAAIQAARHALLTGGYRKVLAFGLEKMPRGFMDMDYFDGWRQRIGHGVNPAQLAFQAQHHMQSSTTEEQLALVAEKKTARTRSTTIAPCTSTKISVEEYVGSRPVVDPLRLLMLCTPM